MDDEDREAGYDDIIVEFNKPVDYIKSEVFKYWLEIRISRAY